MHHQAHIAVFASGNGTNAEEIFKFFKDHPAIKVVLLLTNNPNAFAIERAKRFEIPVRIFDRKQFRESEIVLEWLQQSNVTHIVLAGFLWMIPEYLLKAYPDKIVNIHPALLPKFGGKGMYGMKVHEAVRKSADKETGITIHLVNEHYDEGRILFQAKCPVEETHTPEQIAECVHRLEYEHYPRVIHQWVEGKIN